MGKKSFNDVIEPKTIKKGLKLTIILSLFISALLILLTIDSHTLGEAFSSVSPKIILLLFLILFFNWVFAGLQLKILINTTGERISLLDSIIIYLAGAFISNVTPFATGGGPFQIYFLHKKGVNIGKASTVIVIQFILRLFFFGIASTIFILFFNWAISPGIVPGYLFYLALGFGFLISLFLILFCIIPSIMDYFIDLIFKIKKLRCFFKNNHRAKKLLVRARRELREFRYSFDMVSKYKTRILFTGLFTIMYWSSLFLIIPVILKGLGLEPHFFNTYVMQTIYYLILPYMPTPGASGIAEIGFASLFISFVPKSLIGVVTFAWRFFSFYIILIVGGFFALREFSSKGRKDDE